MDNLFILFLFFKEKVQVRVFIVTAHALIPDSSYGSL